MSIKVKDRLMWMGIRDTTTEERAKIDREIEQMTHQPCDDSIKQLTDDQVQEIVDRIRGKTTKVKVEKEKKADLPQIA